MGQISDSTGLSELTPAPERSTQAEPAESLTGSPADGPGADSDAVTPQRSLSFLIGSLAGGNFVSMALRLASGVLIGRFVAPSTLGLFNGIGLALGYAPVLQLGVLNGLNRELPYHVGRGHQQLVRELAAAAQAWALIVGSVVAMALLGVAGWHLAEGETLRAAGWFTHALLALNLFYNTNYLQMTYRTSHDFARLALVGVVEAGLLLALISVVWWQDFYGLCLRALIAGAVSTAILHYWRPVRVGPRWDFPHLKHLLIVGAPIFGVGMLYGWWTTINSTLVLRLAGTEGMGLFSMVLVAIAAVEFIPQAVSQVVYPRMAEQYGRNSSVEDLAVMVRKPILITAVGLVLVVGVGWWFVGPAVRLVVPAYVDAVPAMQWGLLLPVVSSFQPANSIFNVVRRQDMYVAAILLGYLANGLSLLWLINGQVDLTDFPQAMVAGRIVYMFAAYLFIRYLRRTSEILPT